MLPEERFPFRVLADRLKDDWSLKARPSQLPPPGHWLVWLVMAGRGFGKSRTGSEWVRMMVEGAHARRIALIGPTVADVRKTMIEGPSGLLSISPAWNRPTYEPSNRVLRWPNGAIATTFSAEEPERLRGPEHDACWADELGAWRNQRETWDQLQFGMRVGSLPRIVATTTPRPTPLIRELVARAAEGKGVVITRGSTHENAENLPRSFLDELYGRYGGTRIGRQELEAELLTDTPGALWTRALLDETRWTGAQWPPMQRIVVAVDPALSHGEDSDETGIVVAGLGHDGHAYVLEDASGRFGPTEWARRAVALYHRHSASRIVAERNAGGNLVETTIRAVDSNVALKTIHTSQGKVTRAEPIAAFFEQGRAHLCGVMDHLEDQLVTFAPGVAKSPDRLDAMVYAVCELMGVGGSNTGMIDYMAQLVIEMDRSPGSESEPRDVQMLAPSSCSMLSTITGRSIAIGPSRVVHLTAEEAAPMRAVPGWVEYLKEIPNV